MLTETCIFCGHTFHLPEELQGRKVKCPNCKEVLGISVRRQDASTAQDEPPAQEPVVASEVEAVPEVVDDDTEALRFEGEELVFETRPSMAALALRLAVVIVVMVGAIIGLTVSPLPMTYKLLGAVGGILLAGLLSVEIWLAWANALYVLTSSRAIARGGVVWSWVRSCPLEHVCAVTVRIGPIQRLLGMGTVRLNAARLWTGVKWANVEDPLGVADLGAQQVDHRYTFLAETEGALRSRVGH